MIPSRRRWEVTRDVACGCVLALGVCVPLAGAQTFFKWTDQSGTVHFSDSPPPAGQTYEQREVGPLEPPVKGQAPLPGENTAEGDNGGGSESTGPSRVILTSKEAAPRGTESRHVVGSVKNVGGRPADRVGVTLRVVDANGQECTREEVNVEPTTLNAGQNGNFDTTVESPCFADGAMVDAQVHWD